jgi:hypothetical protein
VPPHDKRLSQGFLALSRDPHPTRIDGTTIQHRNIGGPERHQPHHWASFAPLALPPGLPTPYANVFKIPADAVRCSAKLVMILA